MEVTPQMRMMTDSYRRLPGKSIQKTADEAGVSYCTIHRLLNETLPRIKRDSWKKLSKVVAPHWWQETDLRMRNPIVTLSFRVLRLNCRHYAVMRYGGITVYEEGVCRYETEKQRCNDKRCPILKGDNCQNQDEPRSASTAMLKQGTSAE
jgi:hypothetical protein